MGYYETDSRRISFAEYWRLAPLGLPLSWTMKVLGQRLDFGYAIPYPTRIVRLASEGIPQEHAESRVWTR
jgi:hypothetical protein